MQYIGLSLENERGQVIDKSEVNLADILSLLDPSAEKEYPWLWGIDPYGNTILNLRQVPYLISDLSKLREFSNEAIRKKIDMTIEFVQKIKQHNYIKLSGD